MDEITVNKEKIVLKFSEEELGLLGNVLNEACNGFKVLEFNAKIGTSIEKTEAILKFIGHSYRKTRQARLDKMSD